MKVMITFAPIRTRDRDSKLSIKVARVETFFRFISSNFRFYEGKI